jgi:hypothetical protein
LNNAVQILIASSNDRFLRRFQTAFVSCAIGVLVSTDGCEALTRLEFGGIDILLLGGGYPGSSNGLKGIAGDELAHMWRQIEGRANHLVIGYVSKRLRLGVHRGANIAVQKAAMSAKLNELAAIVRVGETTEPSTSHFFSTLHWLRKIAVWITIFGAIKPMLRLWARLSLRLMPRDLRLRRL